MADALPEPLEMEHIPIDLRQDMSGSRYNTEQSNLIPPVDRSLHHLDYKYSSSVKSPNPSYQQQADQPVGSNNSVDDNNNTPHFSYNQSYHANSPSPQSPSPRLHYNVTEEGSVHHPSKSNEDAELDKDYEFAMNPQPLTRNPNSFGDVSNVALIPDTQATEHEAMDVDAFPVYSIDQSTTIEALTETLSSQTKSSPDSNSDLGVYNPYVQPRQISDSPSTVSPSSNLKHVSNPKAVADQFSLTVPTQGSQRHLVDRIARDEKNRLERLMSPDDEQDSLLDPSQGVTSLMDMMQLVQLTKTEKSTKTRMVILQKIIQTDDIALLQKFVHHEERIGIRTLGNWLYSYYDKKMMRITMNILKALDKLPTYASDLRHLKIQGVVRLIATMSTGSDDPPEMTTAVTNLDAKWERTHHYQPTKDEAINLEAALAETRANKEARGTAQGLEQDSKSSTAGSKSESGDGRADSLKRSHKSAEQDLKQNVKRVKSTATKESASAKAKAVTDTDFFNRLLAPKRPQAPEPSKPKTSQSTSDTKASTFNANELKKAKTAGRAISPGKSSDFSLDALLSTIGRSPEQKRSPESPPKSPPPTTNSTKSPEATGSDSAGTKRKRGVTFAPDDQIAEYRYYTPIAEEWADQPTGETINHEHGNARDLDVGEGRMAFERTHPAQESEGAKDWHTPSPIRLPDHLVLALPDETAESKAQAIREESTFAAVYTSLAHIPPSPAEPTETPPAHPDANVIHIPLEDMYTYQVNAERAKAPPQAPLPTDPAMMNNLLAAAGSVLQSMNGVSQSQIPVQAPVPPPQTNANGSVDLSLVDGLLKNPSLVQSLLGLMGTAPNTSSNSAIASPPMNTLPPVQPASITSSNTWQQSHATPQPPPPQQPPRQPYNYYQPSPPQQYQSPNRNQQYGNNQSYPDQSYSAPGQPTPTARGQYSASGPVPSGPSQRPAINPNFRGGFRGGARGMPRGGRGKGPRGGRGNKFRGTPNRF